MARNPTEPLTNDLLREYRGTMPNYVFEDAAMGDIDARRKAAAAINVARTSCVVRVDAEVKPERPDPPWLNELLDALGWQGGTASDALAAVRRLIDAGAVRNTLVETLELSRRNVDLSDAIGLPDLAVPGLAVEEEGQG